MPRMLSRRTLLASGAGAGLLAVAGGCALAQRHPAVAPTPKDLFPVYVRAVLSSPSSVAQFAAFAPALRPQTGAPPGLIWSIWPSAPFQRPEAPVELDAAIRGSNLDVSTLLPGALQAFTAPGGIYGLPVAIRPTVVIYRPDAFRAAGTAIPSAEWTIDGFVRACEALQAAAKAGILPSGVYGPLPPLLGTLSYTSPYGGGVANGALDDSAVLCGFAAGYGGWLAKGGQYDLTNPGALAAFGKLIAISQAYGGPTALLRPASGAAQVPAMRFQSAADPLPAGYRGARFPVLPERPAVPAMLVGVSVGWLVNGGIFGVFSGVQPPSPPAGAAAAVVDYARWQYEMDRGQPGLATLPPPVLADAKVQAAYWSAPARAGTGGAAAGDWRNYVYDQQDWPPTSTAGNPATGMIFDALSEAAQGRGKLTDLLAAAETSLNQQAVRYETYVRAHVALLQSAARSG